MIYWCVSLSYHILDGCQSSKLGHFCWISSAQHNLKWRWLYIHIFYKYESDRTSYFEFWQLFTVYSSLYIERSIMLYCGLDESSFLINSLVIYSMSTILNTLKSIHIFFLIRVMSMKLSTSKYSKIFMLTLSTFFLST